MTATLSLGAMMRQRLSTEQHNPMLRLQREAQERGFAAQAALAQVEQFFASAQQSITQDIQANRAVKPIQLGHGQNGLVYSHLMAYRWNGDSAGIEQPRHPYYPVWERFAAWANANDLRPKWKYLHDGGGIDSWYELVVTPA